MGDVGTAAGISIYRQRLLAFTLSGALAGFAGGIYVHLQPLQVNGLYLDLTFITLAMLVVGGAGSLLGAVVGALALNGIFDFFSAATNTVDVFGWHLKVPAGTAELRVALNAADWFENSDALYVRHGAPASSTA